MYIKSKYAKIALKNADAKRKARGIVFDPADIELYRAKLKKLAAENVITEGTALDYTIYYAIRTNIKSMIESAIEDVRSKDEEFRKNVSASDYVLAAHDYLLAMATIELGSPDIPVGEFGANFASWTQSIIEAKPNYSISADDTFNNQRRIDALDLTSNKIEPLLLGLNRRAEKSILGKTFGISYVGKMDWCGLERYVDDLHAYIGEKHTNNMLIIEVMTVGADFSLTFMQSGRGEKYLDAFIEELRSLWMQNRCCTRSFCVFPH